MFNNLRNMYNVILGDLTPTCQFAICYLDYGSAFGKQKLHAVIIWGTSKDIEHTIIVVKKA